MVGRENRNTTTETVLVAAMVRNGFSGSGAATHCSSGQAIAGNGRSMSVAMVFDTVLVLLELDGHRDARSRWR